MDRRKLAGLAFVGCLQFFVVEGICATRFVGGYSYFRNYISDLGAATCTIPNVCSPLHGLMNASFALQGGLIATGALLLWPMGSADPRARNALVFLMLCAFGVLLVSVAPEDVASPPHYVGAGLHLIPCNLALLSFAFASRRPPLPSAISAVSGGLGLAGVLGSAVHIYLGLGPGGMERIAAYPFILTLAASGAALIRQAPISVSAPEVRPGFPEA